MALESDIFDNLDPEILEEIDRLAEEILLEELYSGPAYGDDDEPYSHPRAYSAPNDNDEAPVRASRAQEKVSRALKNPAMLGRAALGAIVATAIVAPMAYAASENVRGAYEARNTANSQTYAYNTAPRVTSFDNIYVTGGNGQPIANIQEYIDKGYLNPGDNAVPNQYPASMGPWATTESGAMTWDSVNIGASQLFDKWSANHAAGKNTEFIGYSLGTMVTYEALQRVKAANGGEWPNDLHVVVAGAPQINGGILGPDSPWMGIGTMGLGVPKTAEHPYPPGTVVYYFHDDVYANSGNESFMTLLHDVVGIAAGSHDLPNQNDPNLHYTEVTDKDGVIHRIYYRENDSWVTLIQNAGIQVADTYNANLAFNALFPHNDDPNSTEIKEADVKAFMTYGAAALDHQIGPNVTIFQDIVKNLPDQWKEVINNDFNGFNHIAEAVARAANDPSYIPEATAIVMQEIGKMLNGFGQVMGNQPIKQVENITVNTLGDQIEHYTGLDLRPQLQQLADSLMTKAQEIAVAAQQQRQQQPSISVQLPAAPQLTIDGQQTPDVPTNPGQIIPPSITNLIPGLGGNNNTEMTTDPAPTTTPAPNLAPAPDAPAAPEIPVQQAPAPEVPAETTPPSVVSTPAPAPVAPAPAPRVEAPAPAPVVVEAPAPVAAPAPEVPATPPVYEAPEPVAPPEVAPPAPAPAPAPAPIFEAPAPVITPPVVEAPAPAPVAPAPVSLPDLTPPVISAPAPSAPADSSAPDFSRPGFKIAQGLFGN